MSEYHLRKYWLMCVSLNSSTHGTSDRKKQKGTWKLEIEPQNLEKCRPTCLAVFSRDFFIFFVRDTFNNVSENEKNNNNNTHTKWFQSDQKALLLEIGKTLFYTFNINLTYQIKMLNTMVKKHRIFNLNKSHKLT